MDLTQSAAHRPTGASRQAASPAHAPAPSGRVEDAFDRARRHSGRVRLLKLALPAAALLMIAGFVGKSWLSAPPGVSVDLGATAIENGRLVMADPRLDGFTSDNRSYTMTAARAIQDIGGDGRIDLEEIDARLPFDESNWLTVAARTGSLDRQANTLALDNEITFTTDSGITAHLKSATVDMAAGSLDTADPVDITLEGARIEADSLSVRDRGAVMIFENRVRMEIDGKRLQTAATPDGGTDEN